MFLHDPCIQDPRHALQELKNLQKQFFILGLTTTLLAPIYEDLLCKKPPTNSDNSLTYDVCWQSLHSFIQGVSRHAHLPYGVHPTPSPQCLLYGVPLFGSTLRTLAFLIGIFRFLIIIIKSTMVAAVQYCQ